LNNNFILSRLNENQILILIKISNALNHLESVLSQKSYFQKMKIAKEYNILPGSESGPYSKALPSRYILLKTTIYGDRSVVEDFGDFPPEYFNNSEELLYYYEISTSASLMMISSAIKDLLELIADWYKETGKRLFL